jgi:hypothetical protein
VIDYLQDNWFFTSAQVNIHSTKKLMMFQNYVLVDVLEEIKEVPGLSRVLRRRAWRKIAHLREDGFVFVLASI